jgi:mRNA-degrading endonuclease RelE of RelBE toxin-antitoxin system
MFFFTKYAEDQLHKLTPIMQSRIVSKLQSIKSAAISPDIKRMKQSSIITHRLRIGDYRLLLQKREDGYVVLKL